MSLTTKIVNQAVAQFLREGFEVLPSPEARAFVETITDSAPFNAVMLKFMASYQEYMRQGRMTEQLTLVVRMVQLGYQIHSLAMIEGMEQVPPPGSGSVM